MGKRLKISAARGRWLGLETTSADVQPWAFMMRAAKQAFWMVSRALGSTKMADSGTPCASAVRAMTRASSNWLRDRAASQDKTWRHAALVFVHSLRYAGQLGGRGVAIGIGRIAQHNDGVEAIELGVAGPGNVPLQHSPSEQAGNGSTGQNASRNRQFRFLLRRGGMRRDGADRDLAVAVRVGLPTNLPPCS